MLYLPTQKNAAVRNMLTYRAHAIFLLHTHEIKTSKHPGDVLM